MEDPFLLPFYLALTTCLTPSTRLLKMRPKCRSASVPHCFHRSDEGFRPSATVCFPNTWVRQKGGAHKFLTVGE